MTIAYRLPGNQMTINIDGAMLRAADDGFFRVDSGSRAEAVLLAGGAQLAPAGAIPGDSSDVGLTLPEVLAARSVVAGYSSDIYIGSRTGRKLVIWGDSTAAQNDASNSGYRYLGNAWVQKGLYCAGNPLDVVNVGGNSGLRTDQIIPNFAAQVSAYSPDYVLLPVCTNDLIQGYGNSAAINGLMTMVGLVESIGAVPILSCLTPGDTWASSSANRALWKTHNTLVRSIGAAMGYPVWDGSSAFAITAGEPDAIVGTNDGIHMNNTGTEYLAPVLGAFFKQHFPRRKLGSQLATGNLCTNPLLTGTGGAKQSGVTGVVPDGCTAAQVAASVSSVALRTDGGPGNWWQQSLTLAAGTGSVWYFGTATLAAAGLAVGDIVRASVDVELDNGSSGLHSIALNMSYTGGSQTLAMSNNDATNNGVAIIGAIKRQLATPKIAIPSGTTAIGMYLTVQTNTSAGSAVVRVGAPSIVKVS